MRLVYLLAIGLLCAVGCGDDEMMSMPDASLPRCVNTPNQGSLCSPDVNTPCLNGIQLLCSCECGFLWVCGLNVACDMGEFQITPLDMTFNPNHD